ncbi:hypothetical protein IWW57_000638 [Coemansia sp. S610]|nr:hypothetical protein IWW57_000638 [Coemansia sp. S610]
MNFIVIILAFFLLFPPCLATREHVFTFRQAGAIGTISFAAGLVASKLAPIYGLGGWYADAKLEVGSYRIAYRPSLPLQSPQVAAPGSKLQFSTRTDLIVIQTIREPQPVPVDEGDDFWLKFSEEYSPMLLRLLICVVLFKKTGAWKFVRQVMSTPASQPTANQPKETKAIPHDDTEARVALVANDTAPDAPPQRDNAIGLVQRYQHKIVVNPHMIHMRQIVFDPDVLFLREIVSSPEEFLVRKIVARPSELIVLEIVVRPNALLVHKIVVNSAVLFQHIAFVSPGTLLVHGNVVIPDMLCRCDNLVSPSASPPFGNATNPSVLLCRYNTASPTLARQHNEATSTAELPQRNIIVSPGAPLLRNPTVCPSLLLQHCITASSSALQLPIILASAEEPQPVDKEADAAHVVGAVARRVLRLTPGLAAGPDMPTSARPRAPSAPCEYTANRNSVIILSPVRRRAYSVRSIPMSQLMDPTSNTIPRRRLSRRATVSTMPALRRQNTMPSLPPRIGANSAPSSPAQAPLSVANKQVPMPPPPARVASLGDLLTAAAEAVDSSPELKTIAEEDDGMAALGDACDEAFSSTGSIDTDFDPFQQASFSSLAPANARPHDQQELNGTPVTSRLRSHWPGNEPSSQTLSRYSEKQASTAYSMYSSSSLASNSMQSLWQDVDPSTERFSTLSEFTASNQQLSTSSLVDTASAVSPRKRDILKNKLLGRSTSTFSLRSALRSSSEQASDSGVERVSTSRKLSLSGALKSLKHKTSSKFGLNASSTTTQTPTPSDPVSTRPASVAPLPPEQSNAAGPSAPRRASSLSLRAFIRRSRSEVSTPSVDQTAKRESSGHSDESGQAL